MDCRVAYDYVKACLADPEVSKVVLVGHSQGGIIVSMVLDKLFGALPADAISKLVNSAPSTLLMKYGLTYSPYRRSIPSVLPLRTSTIPFVVSVPKAVQTREMPTLKSTTAASLISSITATSET